MRALIRELAKYIHTVHSHASAYDPHTSGKFHVSPDLQEEFAALFDVEVSARIWAANEHDRQLPLVHELRSTQFQHETD